MQSVGSVCLSGDHPLADCQLPSDYAHAVLVIDRGSPRRSGHTPPIHTQILSVFILCLCRECNVYPHMDRACTHSPYNHVANRTFSFQSYRPMYIFRELQLHSSLATSQLHREIEPFSFSLHPLVISQTFSPSILLVCCVCRINLRLIPSLIG